MIRDPPQISPSGLQEKDSRTTMMKGQSPGSVSLALNNDATKFTNTISGHGDIKLSF